VVEFARYRDHVPARSLEWHSVFNRALRYRNGLTQEFQLRLTRLSPVGPFSRPLSQS
jgi:hypothetical protein